MRRLILYIDSKTNKELCRDNECLFEPQSLDIVDLTDFPLSNTLNNSDGFEKKWLVQSREVNNGLLKVYLSPICK